jgi:hypothetical protein
MVKENISLEISLLLVTFCSNVGQKSRNRKTTLQGSDPLDGVEEFLPR